MAVSAMEPMFPEAGPLEEPALTLLAEASALGGQLHPRLRGTVADLLRATNTYHSNLIEGHNTRPRDIERALRGRLDSGGEGRALQIEALAHIEVQKLVERRLEAEPALSPASFEFLSYVHREFYARMPAPFLVVRDPEGRRERPVVPGQLRDEEVEVGRHVAPPAADLSAFMEAFAGAYDPARLTGLHGIVAIAASHHRLLWIHPFLDGNGRVARLFSDACLRRAGLGGHGLWTVSRGLARQRGRYLDLLAQADAERAGDYDGRGARSLAALTAFARFFLDVCLDQVRFMSSLLQLDGLLERIEGYVDRRQRGGLGPRLPSEARHLLAEALLRGQVVRGEAARVTGLSERSARRAMSLLVREGLLASDTPKGPVRLAFPVKVVGFYFPQLFPEDVL